MKYAVIFTTTENIYEFRPTQGLYKKNCDDLEKAGYTLLTVNVENQDSIEQLLASLPDGSIGFLWNRMHGHPKTMRAAKSFDITSSNLQNIFRNLPKKLRSNATLYLDACHTASLKEDFYNNIQFTFAKLTLDMPNVQITGPTEACHIAWFSLSPNDTFSFNMLADPAATRSMAVTLGSHTKAMLQTAAEHNTPLDSIKKELLDSLIQGDICGNFYTQFDERLSSVLRDAHGYDLREATILAIQSLTLSDEDTRECVQALVEKYHVSVSAADPELTPLHWSHATLLSTAICANKPRVVSYLLHKGANPYQEVFANETLYEFLKKASQAPDEYGEHYKKMLSLIDLQKDPLYSIVNQVAQYGAFMPPWAIEIFSSDIKEVIEENLLESALIDAQTTLRLIEECIEAMPTRFAKIQEFLTSKKIELSEKIAAQTRIDRKNIQDLPTPPTPSQTSSPGLLPQATATLSAAKGQIMPDTISSPGQPLKRTPN